MIKATPLILILLVGCTRTEHKERKTGLFDNDLTRFLEHFQKIENGKTNLNDLGVLGFDLRAHNIELIEGVDAFKTIYGPEAFRNIDPSKMREMLADFNRYKLIRIPYRNIVTVEDRFYFSTKEEIKTGDDVNLSMVIMDNQTVIYHAVQHLKINEREVDYAFAQGLLDIFEDLVTPTKAIKDLVEKWKE
ncbi:MAG: hypothetical protein HYT03_03525 [Candidatus Harrisonbacteria bacterium]|nr:hypothetical protein [Candidatus Harrisonbacteria bacterium]